MSTKKRTHNLSVGLAVAFLLVALGSCDVYTNWKDVTWNHYAAGFCLRTDIMADCLDDSTFLRVFVRDYFLSQNTTLLDPFHVRGDDDPKILTLADTDPKQKAMLEELILHFQEAKHPTKKYGGFTLPSYGFEPELPRTYFLATPIDDISLTSDIDWGEDYPVGTPLDDQFYALGQCHDLYAKRLIKPEPRPIPKDFSVGSEHFMSSVRGAFDYLERGFPEADGCPDIILSKLSEIDFTAMDYFTPFVELTSDDPHLRMPQTITFRVTFRDGSQRTASVDLMK